MGTSEQSCHQTVFGPLRSCTRNLSSIVCVEQALARRLLALAKEAHTAKLRTLLVTRVDSPRAALGEEREGGGSVEYAIQRLEAYSSWLENRVLTRSAQQTIALCGHIASHRRRSEQASKMCVQRTPRAAG